MFDFFVLELLDLEGIKINNMFEIINYGLREFNFSRNFFSVFFRSVYNLNYLILLNLFDN